MPTFWKCGKKKYNKTRHNIEIEDFEDRIFSLKRKTFEQSRNNT